MENGNKTIIRILTLTINEKQCDTGLYTKEIDQSAASIRVHGADYSDPYSRGLHNILINYPGSTC